MAVMDLAMALFSAMQEVAFTVYALVLHHFQLPKPCRWFFLNDVKTEGEVKLALDTVSAGPDSGLRATIYKQSS